MEKSDLRERVDQGILAHANQLSKLRGDSIRASVENFRHTSIENKELCDVNDIPDARDEYDLWALRVDRCDALLVYEDNELRKMARVASDRAR